MEKVKANHTEEIFPFLLVLVTYLCETFILFHIVAIYAFKKHFNICQKAILCHVPVQINK